MTFLRQWRQPGKIRYSELESRILEAIPDNGEGIDTLTLVERFYAADERPRHARQSVLNAANCLIDKVNDNQEAWQIFKGAAAGCHPIAFWRRDRVEVAEGAAAPAETAPAIRPPGSPREARMMAKAVIRLQLRLQRQIAEASETQALIAELSAAARMFAPTTTS